MTGAGGWGQGWQARRHSHHRRSRRHGRQQRGGGRGTEGEARAGGGAGQWRPVAPRCAGDKEMEWSAARRDDAVMRGWEEAGRHGAKGWVETKGPHCAARRAVGEQILRVPKTATVTATSRSAHEWLGRVKLPARALGCRSLRVGVSSPLWKCHRARPQSHSIHAPPLSGSTEREGSGKGGLGRLPRPTVATPAVISPAVPCMRMPRSAAS